MSRLLRCAEMTFTPVLQEASQSEWWLIRCTAGGWSELDFGAKKVRASRISSDANITDQSVVARDELCESEASWGLDVLFCQCFPRKVSVRWRSKLFYFAMPTSFCVPKCHLFLLYWKRNIDLWVTQFARKRNLIVKKCKKPGQRDYMKKNLNPVSLDPGTAIPGSRLTGLAQLSCNSKVDFYSV